MMRKIGLLILVGLSVISAIASVGWIFLAGLYFTATGGTYGYTTEDGAIVCGIPVFTSDNWLPTLLLLFGSPLVVLVVAVKLFNYGKHRLVFGSLR